MQISVKTDIDKLTKKLNDIQRKHIPYATALALTKSAQKAKDAVRQSMESVFDRPTRYTLNSLYIKAATKGKLFAVVGIKDESFKGTPAFKYLKPQLDGGERPIKRSERWLGNNYFTPGKSAKLNRYGNLSAGQITKALANVGALQDRAQNTNKGGRGYNNKKYFYGTIKGTTAVWERYGPKGSKVKPFMVMIRKPTYTKRLDFDGIVQRTARQTFKVEFESALKRALATAK